ncbi:MAG: hypothetical protein IPK58_12355 [Acidobacteria bacterium]|nr:hypothetical protein [Acidobacteriota bacterium]
MKVRYETRSPKKLCLMSLCKSDRNLIGFDEVGGKMPKIGVLICTITLMIILQSFGNAQEKAKEADSIANLKISIKLENGSLSDFVKILSENYGVQIGFEESNLDRDHWGFWFQTNPPYRTVIQTKSGDGRVVATTVVEARSGTGNRPINLVAKESTLDVVLNKVVGQMSNYNWEYARETVNIFPKIGRDEKLEQLLNLRIAEFRLNQDATVEGITGAIQRLPEFRKFLKSNRLIFTGIRDGEESALKAQYGRSVSKSIDLRNLTLREILNEIAKAKKGGWSLRWARRKSNGLDYYFDLDI